MNLKTQQNPAAGSDKPRGPLKSVDLLLKDAGKKKVTESQIAIILDALANSDDAEVVARFAAVLAVCARRGMALNSQALFSRYWETSPKRQNLEKMLLISAALFKQTGLEPPVNLDKIAAFLESKYANLLSGDEVQLSSGMCVSIRALRNGLRIFTAEGLQTPPGSVPPKGRSGQAAELSMLLDRLFSPKQKELVFKKRDGKTFTKTEREYYSRTVRKKLEAIASEQVTALARKLVAK